jgi:hypothetical protein
MSKNYTSLPLSGSVKSHYEHSTVKNNIVSILQHIPEIDTLKGQSKLLEIVCQMVEDRIKQGNSKKTKSLVLDKKKLVVDILDKLFNLNAVEKQVLNKNIDYIMEHKHIILKNTLYRRIKSFFKSLFLDPNQDVMDLMNTPITPSELSNQGTSQLKNVVQ